MRLITRILCLNRSQVHIKSYIRQQLVMFPDAIIFLLIVSYGNPLRNS